MSSSGYQPMASSRVPAGEVVSSKVLAKGAVQCKRTEPEWGGGRIVRGLATTDKPAIARAFGMMTRPGQDRDVTN